jgi:hypothetical protein
VNEGSPEDEAHFVDPAIGTGLGDPAMGTGSFLRMSIEAIAAQHGFTVDRKPGATDVVLRNGSDQITVVEVKDPHLDDGRYYTPPAMYDLVARAALAEHLEASAARATPPSRRSVSFAARLAGRRRLHLRDEWATLLAGEDGTGLPRQRQLTLVLGYVLAALRMRAHDVLGVFWRPVDWLLTVESRTNAMITGVVGSLVIYIQAKDGFHALVTDGWEPCALLGGGLFALARWLRRVRGIELAHRTTDE